MVGRIGMLVLVVAAALASGCTGFEPAVVGAAVVGVETGISATRWGKLNLAYHTDGATVAQAVRDVLGELGLVIVEEQQRGRRWAFDIQDNRRNSSTIVVEERATALTHVQINVGWLGSGAIAQLLGKRITTTLYGEKELDHVGGG